MELDKKIKDSCFEFAQNPIVHNLQWINDQEFSKKDTERIPTVWSAMVGGCEISIMCSHRDYPNTWIMICRELHVLNFDLKCKTAQKAAIWSVQLLTEKVARMHRAFQKCSP